MRLRSHPVTSCICQGGLSGPALTALQPTIAAQHESFLLPNPYVTLLRVMTACLANWARQKGAHAPRRATVCIFVWAVVLVALCAILLQTCLCQTSMCSHKLSLQLCCCTGLNVGPNMSHGPLDALQATRLCCLSGLDSAPSRGIILCKTVYIPRAMVGTTRKSLKLPRCIMLADKLSRPMATEELHMSYLLGGQSWLRALLKAAELHAQIHVQGLVALDDGLIAVSGVTSGVPLQCCQLVLHQLYVVRCRGALSRVFLSVMRAESICQLRWLPKKPYQELNRDSILGPASSSVAGLGKAC